MPVEPHQVENPLHQPPDPPANAGRRDPVAAGDRRDRLALMDLRHGSEDVPDVVGLARQRIAGQHPLPRSTASTPRQPDAQPPIARGRLQAPLHPAAGQRELVAAAPGAGATAENRVVRARQDLGIAARIDGKYVDHRVPSSGPGASQQRCPGPVLSLFSRNWIVLAGRIRDGERSDATGGYVAVPGGLAS